MAINNQTQLLYEIQQQYERSFNNVPELRDVLNYMAQNSAGGSAAGPITDPLTFDVDRTGSYSVPFDGAEIRISATDAQDGKVAVIPVLRNTAPTLTELAGITIVKTEGQFVENEVTPQILTLTHLRDGEVIVRWHSALQQITTIPFAYTVACSDETTDLDLIDPAIVFRMPFGCTLTEVRASVNVAQASGSLLTVDIKAGGTTIFGANKLTVDNAEKTSVTATTPATLNTTVIADDTEMQVLIPQLGDAGAKGLKVTFIGVRSI